MGVTDISSFRWTTSTEWGGHPVALEESAEAKMTLSGNAEEEILAALEVGWGDITGAFGLPQPPRAILVKQITWRRRARSACAFPLPDAKSRRAAIGQKQPLDASS
ncbi:MAG TPA: hypothetical protein VEZ20_12595 [Allosphingosinicella sp.]|jgi:hypothetical protein|nr:hypothetical protein [Allosphingosinicella sp.]